MTDPEKIAAGLSEAQRNAMLGEADADMPGHVAMKLSLELRLTRPCLKDASKPADIDNLTMCFSPLGLAVRAILEKKNAD